jgi:anti-sigma factor RsiW
MSDPQHHCQRIQEEMAWGRGLREEDQQHVLSCEMCSETAAQLKKLDSLVRSVIGADVPDGFADRVIGRLEKERRLPESSFPRKLATLERLLFSKAVQWALVGIGSVVGLIKILSFFAGVIANASI